MELKAVFLDAGGTLLRESPSREAIYAEVASAAGAPIEPERMRELMRDAHRELPKIQNGAFRYSEAWFAIFIERIFGGQLGLSTEVVQRARRELFDRFADARSFRLHDGALELVEAIRARGLRLGVVSNWSERLPGLLDGLGLTPSIEFVLASAIERVEKPDAEIFRRALARAGVDASEALHVGNDLVRDGEGARAVGIEAALVEHDDVIVSAHFRVFPNLFELRTFILERTA